MLVGYNDMVKHQMTTIIKEIFNNITLNTRAIQGS